MSNKWVELLVAAMCSAILLACAHAYDWKKVFGKRPDPPWSYVTGLVLLGIPYLALLAYWRDWWAFMAAVAVVVGGGFPVIFGYNIRGQTKTTDYLMLLSEHLDDERAISMALRRKLMEKEQQIARLIAKLSVAGEGDDG